MNPVRGTRGVTLPELIVVLVITAVLGSALVRMLVVQNRFFDHQLGMRGARSVSRGAVNLLMTDLRMVEASGSPGDTLGIVAAAPRSLTLRVPYAMGMVCKLDATVTVTLVPLDTLMYGSAVFAGYAWRDTVYGKYHYVESGAFLAPASAGSCALDFTPVTGGRVVSVTPVPLIGPLAGGLATGNPVMLYQRIKYDLAPSVAFPGRVGLWRSLGGSPAEELAAPFDSNAVFRFFVGNADTSQAAPPVQLSELRGIDVLLNAMSERAARGSARPDQARVATAVFFRNRLN